MADQAEWLHWIDLVCPVNGKGAAANQTRCLQDLYFTRAHDFSHTARIGSNLIFPRAHFLFKPGGAPANNPISPGFGYGSLRWPQIDRPNPAQSAWNNAAKARADQLAIGFSNDTNATFSTAVDPTGIIDAYYTIQAANDRLIDTTFTDGAFPWGAAHPTSSSTSFLWWLDRGRQLTPTDIFWTDSGWQQKLVPLAIASLQSNPDIKNKIWKGTELNQAVQSAVPEPDNWTITRDGLSITFGQYAVGPYYIGMPQAHLPWSQLKPLLVPHFTSSTLPVPIPKNNP
jgi:hypothetical protein